MFDELYNKSLELFGSTGQNREEIVPVLELLSDNVVTGNFLEIGTQYGGTFYMLSNIFHNKKISIDIPTGVHGGLPKHIFNARNTKLINMFSEVYMIEGDSTSFDTINMLMDTLNDEPLDFLFIDGDHTFEGVSSDFALYKRFVRPGGMIGFHDIVSRPENKQERCHVYDFWNLLEGNKSEFICNCSWTPTTPVMGGIGILKI